ncbi:MAG: NAD-dependent deacylase [Polyangiaceae bacterium]|nr:NAD-dependent deacylase [Polyangiaceae bacterium]
MIDEVAALLRDAESVLFITGAGMSADSGLPTYRGIGGLYEDAATDDGVPIEVALSGPMFAKKPELTWRHIADIERACRGAEPNDGHRAIVEVEAKLPRTVVLTQNVDGLHRAAGTKALIEIHGTVHTLICTRCPARREVSDYSDLAPLPLCASCGAVERPDVVLFGEALPPAAVDRYVEELERGFDLVFSVGTTSVFPYIAEPMVLSRRLGLPAVEINPGETEVSAIASHRIRSGAAEALRAIVKRAFG